ncbi:type II toxin-antitoxin system HicB family antitoxin [Candidatus Pacearchaeota archaeon]|nr:type II toxin-antitoxin system HicB family antitoxin [Candidatus Pacearchaeota archaeon]
MANFNLIIEKGEDGYLISEVVELPGCHTQAKDMNELIKRTKEAISLCLKEQGVVETNTSFIGIQKIEV